MAKLTVFFNYKETYSKLFETGIVRIGRDETNDIIIDSQEAAPAHAAIIIKDNDAKIKQLNDNFPLIVNGKKISGSALYNSDMISMGKHYIVYNTTAESLDQNQPFASLTSQGIGSYNQEADSEQFIPAANLQVMNGPNIGKVLPLKKAMTRLGQSGTGVIVIAKRKDGYFVSALENAANIKINNIPLDDNYLKLNHGDVIQLNNTSLQFFLIEPVSKNLSVF
ncbi:MAG: FHA domain-containing protein [Methylococcaceae bacterium]